MKRVFETTGWTQDEVARHLGMSRAAVSQALCTMALDERVREAMLEKGRTGWRARQADVRRFAKAPVEQGV